MADPLLIVTWNVNSIRVRLDHVRRYLIEWRPDVLCLQETKVTDEQFPLDGITALGYRAEILGQKTYNGVAILARHPIEDVRRGFDGSDSEDEKRLIAGTVRGVRIVNAYVPNGSKVGSDKFAYKMHFFNDLKNYCSRYHNPSEPLALVGDFNVAPAPEDVYDPEALDGTVCYHPDERAAFSELCQWGLQDTFRHLNKEGGQYSWWDYRTGAFNRDAGLRIDFVLATHPLVRRAETCLIDRDERALDKASDHAPVVAAFAPH